MILRSLICHRDVEQSITCLKSLPRTHTPGLELFFHEDRSLTAEDADRLRSVFPTSKILWRHEADVRMAEHLEHYPRCRQFRSENVFGLKLLDTVLLSEGDICAYSDGDILFIRESTGMFEMPTDADAVFMMDAMEPVALTFRELWQRNMKFVSRVNAGMYLVRKEVLDLDMLEWFLGFEMAPHLRHVQEQTAWAWLAASMRARHWDPATVRVVSPRFPVTSDLAAAHFIGIYRDQLPSGVQMLETASAQVPQRIQFPEAARYGWSSKGPIVAARWAEKLGLRSARYH